MGLRWKGRVEGRGVFEMAVVKRLSESALSGMMRTFVKGFADHWQRVWLSGCDMKYILGAMTI